MLVVAELSSPAEFAVECFIIAVMGEAEESAVEGGLLKTEQVAMAELAMDVAIDDGNDILGFAGESYRINGIPAIDNGPDGQCVRADGGDHKRAQILPQNGPTGRETVRGGTDGRGEDESIATVRGHVFVVDSQLDIEHVGPGTHANRYFVQPDVMFNFAIRMFDLAGEHHQFGNVTGPAGEEVEVLLQVSQGEVGQEAESPQIDGQDGDLVFAKMAAGPQQGPIAAEHDGHVRTQFDVVDVLTERHADDFEFRARHEKGFEPSPGLTNMFMGTACQDHDAKRSVLFHTGMNQTKGAWEMNVRFGGRAQTVQSALWPGNGRKVIRQKGNS